MVTILDYLKQPVYAVLIIIGALIVFFMLRTWWRKQKIRLQQINDEDFGKLDKSYRPRRLAELKEEYPGIEEALTWMDSVLMERNKEKNIIVTLLQEWCCEDRTGEAAAPMRTRPSEIVVTCERDEVSHKISGFLDDDYISPEDARILRWALLERCKLMVPLRRYSITTQKIKRDFKPKEGIDAHWEVDSVTKENYTIEVK